MKKSKSIVFLSVMFFALFCSASGNSLSSLLGIPFGEICTIKGEFVQKPDTYYAQNMSHAEFYLKILEINHKKLPRPLIVEPVYGKINIETRKSYSLKAFETVESVGEPAGWSPEAQQAYYTIIHRIVIKLP
jgi:hypothetical protein